MCVSPLYTQITASWWGRETWAQTDCLLRHWSTDTSQPKETRQMKHRHTQRNCVRPHRQLWKKPSAACGGNCCDTQSHDILPQDVFTCGMFGRRINWFLFFFFLVALLLYVLHIRINVRLDPVYIFSVGDAWVYMQMRVSSRPWKLSQKRKCEFKSLKWKSRVARTGF